MRSPMYYLQILALNIIVAQGVERARKAVPQTAEVGSNALINSRSKRM